MLAVCLNCRSCGWQTLCSETEIVERLRSVGLLKRIASPPTELVHELLQVSVAKFRCDQCGKAQLTQTEAIESDDDGDWQQAVVCEVCRQPIASERLEIFPDARRCVDCQDVADRGEELEEAEFCERCGSLVELRVSRRGGITRYRRFCTGNPPCRL